MNEEIPSVPEKSKGQLFKEKYGFSKTTQRNMKKNGINPNDIYALAQYKDIRKENRKKSAATRRKKHEASLVHMRTHGKVRLKGKPKGNTSKKEKK